MAIAMRALPLPLLLFMALPAAAQTAETEVTLGGRVQTQMNTTSVDGLPPSQLLIRRARLGVRVKVNDRITGKVETDFAGDRVALTDAYINAAFSPGVQVRAGQMKRPFSLLETTSSTRMPPIERGLRIRGVAGDDENSLLNRLDYIGRDVGVQLHGSPAAAPAGLSYVLGVSRGPLHGEVGDQDSYQLTGRGSLQVLPAVRLGAAWSARQFTDSIGASPALRYGHAFEVDVEYGSFSGGPHLLGEVAVGDVNPFEDSEFRSAQVWLGYRTAALGSVILGVEPALRVSHADVDPSAFAPGGGTLITPGLNIYLGPLDRLMLNYDIWRGADGSPDAASFKAMLQFAF